MAEASTCFARRVRLAQAGVTKRVGSLGQVKGHLAFDVAREAILEDQVADASVPAHVALRDAESLGVLEHAGHTLGEARPALFFFRELLLARGGDGIESRLA